MKQGQTSYGSNGLQNSLFPIPSMYITQGSTGDYSHQTSKAIDYVGYENGNRLYRAPYYAPFDCTVTHIGTKGDGVVWTSDNEVNTPTGQTHVTIMVWHDNDAPNFNKGDKRKQGELLGHTGTAGNVTGDHVHIEVYKGQDFFDKSSRVNNWELLFVNDTDRVNDYGYAWITTEDSHGGSNTTECSGATNGSGKWGVDESKLPQEVLRYKDAMINECNAQGVPDIWAVLLGVMMIESGGTGGDPMQSSESQGWAPNTIKDPMESIHYGVLHFKDAQEKGKQYNVDAWTTIQSYNFGVAYNEYVGARGGINTLDIAETYSREKVAPSLGNRTGEKIAYNNPYAISVGKPYRYVNGGNFFYAEIIKQYVTTDGSATVCNPKNPNNTVAKSTKLYDLLLSDCLNGWKW